MYENEEHWQIESIKCLDQNDAEIRQAGTFVGVSAIKNGVIDDKRYSSWQSVVRVMGWLERFCFNLMAKKDNKHCQIGKLRVDELLKAEKLLCKHIQREKFSEEYSQLTKGDAISKKNKLVQLSLYLDEDDIVRVAGRIDEAAIPNMARHQIILPGKHYLVNLLIKSFHDRTQNGTEYILAELRQMFWILNARTSTKKVAWQCFNCHKLKSRAVTPYMSNLPTFRIDYQRPPFTNTGLDFFGPMFIKQ